MSILHAAKHKTRIVGQDNLLSYEYNQSYLENFVRFQSNTSSTINIPSFYKIFSSEKTTTENIKGFFAKKIELPKISYFNNLIVAFFK